MPPSLSFSELTQQTLEGCLEYRDVEPLGADALLD